MNGKFSLNISDPKRPVITFDKCYALHNAGFDEVCANYTVDIKILECTPYLLQLATMRTNSEGPWWLVWNFISEEAYNDPSIIPTEDAIQYMKDAATKSYSKKGQDIVEKNWNAIDAGHQNIVKIDVPASWADAADTQMGVAAVTCEDKNLQDYVNKIQIPCNAQKGDTLPVSTFVDMADGTFPQGSAAFEKRGIAVDVPEWIPENCIQCNQCAYVCPHACIRPYIATEEKILNYIDLPLQHCNSRVLKAMNRKGDKESLTALINKIRERIPDVVLRTTLITGFPTETDEEFDELAEFAKELKFERLGCFAYSTEEDTPAAELEQVDKDIRGYRADAIMRSQELTMEDWCKSKIGTTVKVLVEGFDRYAECFFGRSYADAPEVDPNVFFTSEEKVTIGDFVNVEVTDFLECDLIGEVVK